MRKSKNQLFIWFTYLNMRGIISDTPIKGKKVRELAGWYDKEEEIWCSKLGLDNRESCVITFASKSKKEVEIFLKGAKALRKILAVILKEQI